MINIISAPVALNLCKHHFHFLKFKIQEWKVQEWNNYMDEINLIGNNLIDIYFGKITPEDIGSECINHFHYHEIENAEHFRIWLQPEGYRKIELSDDSEWVIREGHSPDRYVHIHPARHSIHTKRVRAGALKTVVAAMTLQSTGNKFPSLDEINQIRINYLDLSPVKAIEPGNGIAGLWEIFIR